MFAHLLRHSFVLRFVFFTSTKVSEKQGTKPKHSFAFGGFCLLSFLSLSHSTVCFHLHFPFFDSISCFLIPVFLFRSLLLSPWFSLFLFWFQTNLINDNLLVFPLSFLMFPFSSLGWNPMIGFSHCRFFHRSFVIL